MRPTNDGNMLRAPLRVDIVPLAMTRMLLLSSSTKTPGAPATSSFALLNRALSSQPSRKPVVAAVRSLGSADPSKDAVYSPVLVEKANTDASTIARAKGPPIVCAIVESEQPRPTAAVGDDATGGTGGDDEAVALTTLAQVSARMMWFCWSGMRIVPFPMMIGSVGYLKSAERAGPSDRPETDVPARVDTMSAATERERTRLAKRESERTNKRAQLGTVL